MSHKTFVNGTAYEVLGGKCLVGGASYGINNGKSLIGGTCYNVPFGSNELILFENGIVQNCEFTADLSGVVISSNQTTGADVAYIDSKTNLLNIGIDVINFNGATITRLGVAFFGSIDFSQWSTLHIEGYVYNSSSIAYVTYRSTATLPVMPVSGGVVSRVVTGETIIGSYVNTAPAEITFDISEITDDNLYLNIRPYNANSKKVYVSKIWLT